MNIKCLIGIFFLVFIAACSEQDKMEIVQSASAFDLTQAKAAIKQSSITLTKAFGKNDTVTIINAYTKDAHLLPAGHEALEEDSLRFYLIQMLNSNVTSIEVKSEGVWGDSVLLAEEGTYSLEGKNNIELDKGKYIVLWKRESGNWKIYRQMWTSDLPANKVRFEISSKPNANKKQ